MNELRVCTYRKYLCASLFELVIPLCQSSEFSSSDKRKIRRIEKKYGPFIVFLQCLKTYFTEVAL